MSGLALLGWASAAVAGLTAWLLLFGIRALRRRAAIRRRMAGISGLLVLDAIEGGPAAGGDAEGPARGANWLVGPLNARYPLAGGIRSAALGIGAGVLCFAGLAAALIFLGLSAPFAYAASALLGGVVAWNAGTLLEDAKRSEFSARFLVILEDMQRMVRYGISGPQALNSAAAAAEEPVATSLRNIVLEVEFGVPVGVALDREARRVRIGELLMLAAVFSTQTAAGGSLSESIENLAKTLRERLDNRSRIKASTAESRVTMIILSLVPVGAIGLQMMLNPEVVEQLFGEGRLLLGIGVGLVAGGLLISWLIIRSAQR